jgi:SMODS and SLOG-associating 2TM effector domain family 4
MSKSIELETLEAQIRECFGRVIYTHKTHSKMADRAAKRLTHLKITQIVLSSLTASGAVSVIFADQFLLKLITAFMSFGTVTLTAYMKGFDPGAAAQKHRDTAADIWPIRESYLSLLSDIISGDQDIVALRQRRDELQASLAAIYRGAPHTDDRAYGDAQTALKANEEYTFSDEEIDAFLPKHLKKEGRT